MQLICTQRQRGDKEYKQFIKSYCVITAPLQELLKKSAHILDTDASNIAIGAVLSQVQDGEEKVIMYGSKSFSGSQR